MVEAAGVEPATHSIAILTKIGRQESCLGPNEAQVGQQQEVGPDRDCTGRTDKNSGGAIPGLGGSTTGAQRQDAGDCASTTTAAGNGTMARPQPEQRDAPSTPSVPEDLREVVEAWARLPEALRAGILAIVKATK